MYFLKRSLHFKVSTFCWSLFIYCFFLRNRIVAVFSLFSLTYIYIFFNSKNPFFIIVNSFYAPMSTRAKIQLSIKTRLLTQERLQKCSLTHRLHICIQTACLVAKSVALSLLAFKVIS